MRRPLLPLGALALALAALLAPQAARAEEQQLQVQVEVVLASRQGQAVEPPELEKMRETFQRKGFPFTSFKRLSQQELQVASGKPAEVKLPNGVSASLKLLKLEKDTATLRVEVPQLSAAEVELGRQGSVYQRAGRHAGGELVLVLSSPR